MPTRRHRVHVLPEFSRLLLVLALLLGGAGGGRWLRPGGCAAMAPVQNLPKSASMQALSAPDAPPTPLLASSPQMELAAPAKPWPVPPLVPAGSVAATSRAGSQAAFFALPGCLGRQVAARLRRVLSSSEAPNGP